MKLDKHVAVNISFGYNLDLLSFFMVKMFYGKKQVLTFMENNIFCSEKEIDNASDKKVACSKNIKIKLQNLATYERKLV